MEDFNFNLEKERKQTVDTLHQYGNYDVLYRWLDKIPFSKRPKTLARDFSDGGKYLLRKNWTYNQNKNCL